MTANPTVWRHLPPARPVPPLWDREFTARCPHGRDVTWLAARSVDGAASTALPWCECETAGEGSGGLCPSAGPGAVSERLNPGTGVSGRPGADLRAKSVSGEDAA